MNLSKIDYEQLKSQKEILIRMIQDWGEASDPVQQKEAQQVEGILYLLDDIQDHAVSNLGLSEIIVFGPQEKKA